MPRLETVRRIGAKEMGLFFAGGMGYLFLAAFLGVTLFVFFWGEAFFVRNIADVRPLFEWMPILLLFLCSALTMRMWSEERRTGTLEFVKTLPVTSWEFVLGKFWACLLLLALALLLTLPLPVTVASLGELDWGPVIAGYIASLLLGGAYIAIGLYISARSDSQIVSLILSVFVCGAFYLAGSGVFTDLVGQRVADGLRALGTGSRFESITRGVLDFRDLFYYLSLLIGFLALNVFSLERGRWAESGDKANHRAWYLGTALVLANLLAGNLWLSHVTGARADLTEGQIYSLSQASKTQLERLQEPLLIRGYFSSKTHPLLAPLVPQMRDLLDEFALAGGANVKVEVVDPVTDPEKEDEANSKYGIRPVPFQVSDRYQSALVNSYFDVLVSYGDEYQVLGFRDLIEIKQVSDADIDVLLRNPEYDLTRAIKKVAAGFRSGGEVFGSISQPVQFVGYVSSEQALPPELSEFRSVIEEVLTQTVADSGGKLSMEFVDPQAGDGAVAQQIAADFGFRPMQASFFDTNTFYYYLTLRNDEAIVQLPLPATRDADSFKRLLDDGLKRFATGLLKTLVLVTPPAPPAYLAQQMAQQGQVPNSYQQLQQFLSADYSIESSDLADGVVPASASILMVLEPEGLTEKQLFAIDQFLMRGGSVVLATSPYGVRVSGQALVATPKTTGLADWLAHHGVSQPQEFVMDPQNSAFPVPVTRRVGGFSFQEMRMLDYPYFIDVRGSGLNDENGITADLPQLTLPWASPVVVDEEANAQRVVTTLLSSSEGSWRSSEANVMPRVDDVASEPFSPVGELGSQPLAVLLEGRFESFFAGKDSPLLRSDASTDSAQDVDVPESGGEEAVDPDPGVVSGVIDKSAESARLFVYSSNSLVADQSLRMMSAADGTIYTSTVQLLANTVDWSLEDRSLLSIRSRGHFNRTLPPMEPSEQANAEYLNYGVAAFGVFLVAMIHRIRRRGREKRFAKWLSEPGLHGGAV